MRYKTYTLIFLSGRDTFQIGRTGKHRDNAKQRLNAVSFHDGATDPWLHSLNVLAVILKDGNMLRMNRKIRPICLNLKVVAAAAVVIVI